MGLASKFNKGGIDWEVDTKDLKFKKTSDLEIGKQYDFLGCYVSKDNGYGEGAVIISKDFQLNAPGYFIDTVREIRSDASAVADIKAGKLAFKVETYVSEKFKRTGYRIVLIDK